MLDRLYGVLYGLAAGDRNGGPTAMALRLSESLLALGKFDPDDVLKHYVTWWQHEGFDTGPVAAQVFERVAAGIPYPQATYQVHLSMDEQTAGCNPAHRIAPIAMAGFIKDTTLSEIAHQEATLTHWDALAGDVAASVLQLCRYLLKGDNWEQVLEQVLPTDLLLRLQQNPQSLINRGGFAPDVLHTAIYFVNSYSNFESALTESIKFAGPANYCPVLVGVFAGARWGRSAIPDKLLAHCERLDKPIERLTKAFSESWK